MSDFSSTLNAYDCYRQALGPISRKNKDAVFDALLAANITRVLADFDGLGDQGQIESVVALRGEAIETLCYDYLEESHGGWEIDDGAYGQFCFDVGPRTVELEFNGRYTATTTTVQKF